MGDTYSPLIGGQTGSINMKNQCGNSNNKIKVKAKTNKKLEIKLPYESANPFMEIYLNDLILYNRNSNNPCLCLLYSQ